MRASRLTFLLIAALALSACATSGMTYREASPLYTGVSAGKARLYVYREASMFGAGLHPSVYLDARKIRDSVPGSYTMLDIEPGSHTLSVTVETEKQLNFTANAKEEIYVREAPGFGYLVGRVHLEPVSATEAAQEIASLHEQPEPKPESRK